VPSKKKNKKTVVVVVVVVVMRMNFHIPHSAVLPLANV
jgi:hypothetical protein